MNFFPAAIALLLFVSPLAARDFHVSPLGSDANPGTLQQPFATVTAARDAIRALKSASGLPSEGIKVWLRGGSYPQSGTLSFDSRDSGTAAAPIVYAAHPGEEAAISGGTALDTTRFVLVTNQSPMWPRLDTKARGQVYAVDLRAQGIANYGTLKPRGFSLREPAPLELFVGGKPMTLARWPNVDDPLARTSTAISSTQIGYVGSRPERWSQAQDAWLHGFWEYAWADFHVPLAGINTAQKTISFATAPAQYGTAANRPYYVYNLIEELDAPGEYFVDRATGMLYVWLESPPGSAPIQVSTLPDALVELNGSQHLTFSDLAFETSRGALVKVLSGHHNRVERCLLRNAGQFALQLGGTQNGIDRSEIVDCNEDGVLLGGGDRASRSPGANYVTNSRIHRTGRVGWTYKPGISFERGAGNIAAHNLLDDMPHSAILLAGNDHVIEFNEIRRVCRATSDAGAIYGGMDWGFRGNVIRYNYLHHIESTQDGQGAHGVYLDDCLSGVEVFGNVFYRIANAAIFCGGGRDNILRNNVIALAGLGHYNDDRGRTRINDTPGNSWNLLERLGDAGIHYQQEPWASAYPAAAAIPNSWAAIQGGTWRNPGGSVFSNNIGWANGSWTFESNSSGTGVFGVYASFTGNQPAHAPMFDERASVDRSARPALLATGATAFTPIPFDQIGPVTQGNPAATSAPSAPVLSGTARSSNQIDLQWADRSNLAKMQESGFVLESRNVDDTWQPLQVFGPDVDFADIAGLLPGRSYVFRVRATNALGSATSNIVTVATLPAAAVAGPATRVEAENPLSVVIDVGGNGSVGISDGQLDSAQSVRLYDAGDSIRVQFTIPVAASYRIGARLRAGGANAATAFWPEGYGFRLDGSPIVLVGNTATLSSLDESYGGCYWGTMTADVTLSAGTHSLEISSNSAWTVADFVEFSALSGGTSVPPPTVPSDPAAPITPTRVEAEGLLIVASDIGGNGSVGISDANLDSGQSVRLYDASDAVRVVINVPSAGVYRIGARVRSGGSTGPTVFWPDGYRFKLDGGALPLTGDALSVSVKDDAYGGCFWGTMRSGDLTLSAGTHTVEIAAASNWAVVDFVEWLPVSTGGTTPPPVTPPTVAAPTLVVPADIALEAAGAGGAVATFGTSARDGAGNSIPTTAMPPSGSLFPLGASTVLVRATDGAGQTSTRAFIITVRDTTPPVLTGPSSITVTASGISGAIAPSFVSASDAVDGTRPVIASPAVGSLLPIGTSKVTVSASDSAGNTASRIVSITVVRPVPASPVGLVAVGWDGEIDLEWNASPFALSYNVKRATSVSGPYTTIAQNVVHPHFSDTDLLNGQTYYYAVSASSAEGESANSNAASATPALRSGLAAWTSSDIGAVGFAGRATAVPGAFSVWGSGADIWDTTDGFHFVYQNLAGDGSITARVTHLQNTDTWAKAGVMIRESLQPNAKFAGIYLTSGNGVASQWRANTGGHCEHRSAAGGMPSWMRLARAGDTITAQTSADGASWTTVSVTQLTMGANAYVGLAVTSHNNGALGMATFDAVHFSPKNPGYVVPPSQQVIARVEAEAALAVVSDPGSNGTVGITDASLDSGQSVRLYDTGDAIRVAFSVPAAGMYRVTARVRTGGTTGAMVFWPGGYLFKLDGVATVLTGDAASLSTWDDGYGGCYWGTMRTETIILGAGSHSLEIAAASTWAAADYVEIIQTIP